MGRRPNFALDDDGISDYSNPYLFTGRRTDILDSGSLKIQYNRNRYFDTYAGRWLTHDPLGIVPDGAWPNSRKPVEQYKDGLNLYAYIKNNPLNGTDIYGLLTCGYHVWCDPPGVGVSGITLPFLRHCDIRKKTGAPIPAGVTTYPVWVIGSPAAPNKTIRAGSKKGCPCKGGCVKCKDIDSCVNEIAATFPWGSAWPNCHTQTKSIINMCCLESTWKAAPYAGPGICLKYEWKWSYVSGTWVWMRVCVERSY